MRNLDATFSALGDETRRAILDRLTVGELKLSELAAPFPMSQTGVSKHVQVLSEAGLVRVEKRGRVRYCRLDGDGFQPAAEWLAEYAPFWSQQLNNLAEHLSDGSAAQGEA